MQDRKTISTALAGWFRSGTEAAL